VHKTARGSRSLGSFAPMEAVSFGGNKAILSLSCIDCAKLTTIDGHLPGHESVGIYDQRLYHRWSDDTHSLVSRLHSAREAWNVSVPASRRLHSCWPGINRSISCVRCDAGRALTFSGQFFFFQPSMTLHTRRAEVFDSTMLLLSCEKCASLDFPRHF